MKLLVSLVVSVVSAVAFGGAVYEVARWGQVRGYWGGPLPADFETRLVGAYSEHEHEGLFRTLELGADGRYTLTRYRYEKPRTILADAQPAEAGRWVVEGGELRLRSEAGLERRATTSLRDGHIDLVLEGEPFWSPRPLECFL